MDKRIHHSTPRGRASYWCQAGGATANSPREFLDNSNDGVSSYQRRTSQPIPFDKSSNKFGHVKKPIKQCWQIRKSPIASGGEDLNRINDVAPVTDAVTSPLETVSVSHSSPNLRDKRLEPLGPGKGHIVDDGEKRGDFLLFGPSSTGSSAHRHDSAAGANSPSEISSGNKDGVSFSGKQTLNVRSGCNNSDRFCNSSGAKDISTGVEMLNLIDEVGTPISATYCGASVSSCEKDYPSNFRKKSLETWTSRETEMVDSDAKRDTSLFSNSNVKGTLFEERVQCSQISQKEIEDSGMFDTVNCQSSRDAFDICPPRSENVTRLNPSLLEQNKKKRAEAKRSMEGQNIIELRSGMILLKKYISLDNQVKIVKKCRDLGVGPGGFYEPGYRDGGKLQLKMMCLGKNWDPQKREYGDKRQLDDAKPPSIPFEFHQLVKGAIEASHSFLKQRIKSLPSMSPNICIINFYTKSGRLGLHQDKDESQESLDKGLPVVSFSIGDSAEFLYGDQRDPEKADKVVLESGDVLIFGGKSRHVFHGVTSISSETAPKALLEETRLRPGRLNLTFREG